MSFTSQTMPAVYSEHVMGQPKTVHLVSGLTTFQLATTPWADPLQQGIRVLRILDLTVTNPAQSGVAIYIWDQDTASTTPPTRGSAGAALITLGAGGATAGSSGTGNTVTYTGNQIAKHKFQGGIAIQGTYPGIEVMAHVIID